MESSTHLFSDLVRNPVAVTIICIVYIVSYYAVSEFFFAAYRAKRNTGLFRKNGWLDVATSLLWFFVSVLLIWSLLDLLIINQLELKSLIFYYILFIFLFAILYALLDWHFSSLIEGISGNPWVAEVQYLVFSIETITTLGHSKAKPNHLSIQCINCMEALLGLFFVAVFIAKAVTLSSP